MPATARLAPVAALCLALAAIPAHADTTGRATVIDGDTIEIHGERIRLDAIDAPESGQTCEADGQPWRCGQQAPLALADKIGAGNMDGRALWLRIHEAAQAVHRGGNLSAIDGGVDRARLPVMVSRWT